MKKLLLLSVASILLNAWAFSEENKVIYEGKYAIMQDKRIIIFYDEHVIEVTQKKHADDCWCHKMNFENN